MPGAVLIVLAVVFVLPSLMLLVGMVISAVFGALLKTNAEAEHIGSELIDANY